LPELSDAPFFLQFYSLSEQICFRNFTTCTLATVNCYDMKMRGQN
jgi:hypothetical protein